MLATDWNHQNDHKLVLTPSLLLHFLYLTLMLDLCQSLTQIRTILNTISIFFSPSNILRSCDNNENIQSTQHSFASTVFSWKAESRQIFTKLFTKKYYISLAKMMPNDPSEEFFDPTRWCSLLALGHALSPFFLYRQRHLVRPKNKAHGS